jgi:hypothetical protein
MKNLYLTFVLAGTILGVLGPPARANEWDKQTRITFSEPVEVPGKILPAGTYQFKLPEGESADRDIVEIYNKDLTHLETTVLAIPDQRVHASGKTVVQFSERPAGSPVAIKAWFYPGAHTGIAFVYPHDRAAQLAKANREPVYSTRSDMSDSAKMRHSQLKRIQPDGSESDITPDNTR